MIIRTQPNQIKGEERNHVRATLRHSSSTIFQSPSPTQSQLQHKKCCTICKKIVSAGNISKHMKKHNEKNIFPCHLCPKTFLVERYLTKHLKIHNNTVVKKYKCDKCAKAFESNSSLQRHFSIHK